MILTGLHGEGAGTTAGWPAGPAVPGDVSCNYLPVCLDVLTSVAPHHPALTHSIKPAPTLSRAQHALSPQRHSQSQDASWPCLPSVTGACRPHSPPPPLLPINTPPPRRAATPRRSAPAQRSGFRPVPVGTGRAPTVLRAAPPFLAFSSLALPLLSLSFLSLPFLALSFLSLPYGKGRLRGLRIDGFNKASGSTGVVNCAVVSKKTAGAY